MKLLKTDREITARNRKIEALENKQTKLFGQSNSCYDIADTIKECERELPSDLRPQAHALRMELNKRGWKLYKESQALKKEAWKLESE